MSHTRYPRKHYILLIIPLVHSCYKTSRVYRMPTNGYPAYPRKNQGACCFSLRYTQRISGHNPFPFIVLERLNAAEMSVTWLNVAISSRLRRDHECDTYVKPCTALPRLKQMSRVDADFVTAILTLHPLAISPRYTVQHDWCIAGNPALCQPDDCHGALVHALQTLQRTAAGRPCQILQHGSGLRCTCAWSVVMA